MTRSCEGPPRARSPRPCARPARRRSTPVPPARRSGGRASTGSTCRPARSWSRATWRSRRSALSSGPTRSATSHSRAWSRRPARRRTRSAERASTASTRSPSPSTPASSCSSTRRSPSAMSEAYRRAGVDLDAAARAVDLIRDVASGAARPEAGDVGGFAGLFKIAEGRWLAAATDGVGTKLEIARLAGRLDTVGIDLVAMCADDVVCTGAEPLFFLDYLAVGKVIPEDVAAIVSGVAEGCRRAGCALLGGETAEHPGVLPIDGFDLAGFCVGVVDEDARLGPHRVEVGDELIGLASSGLHANGYSLVRKALLEEGGYELDEVLPRLGRPLVEELLEPTTIYAPLVVALARDGLVHAAAHVTGGGLPENVPRALPEGLGDRSVLPDLRSLAPSRLPELRVAGPGHLAVLRDLRARAPARARHRRGAQARVDPVRGRHGLDRARRAPGPRAPALRPLHLLLRDVRGDRVMGRDGREVHRRRDHGRLRRPRRPRGRRRTRPPRLARHAVAARRAQRGAPRATRGRAPDQDRREPGRGDRARRCPDRADDRGRRS